ncbi:MAG: hypothetical protein GX288_08960 [Clostridiales bacterium]|nr:hypothetical protein [Clostridiales bacterium]
MKDKINHIIVIVGFLFILYGLMLLNIFLPDKDISYSERRSLAKVPKFTLENLLNGEWFEDYEKYLLDQFVLRDEFRGLKAFTRFYLLRQKDNNDIYVIDGNINKIEYPLNDKAIENAADKLNEVYDKYLEGMNVSYAIIPDKNYFTAAKHGYLSIDYEKLIQIMNQKVKNMNYINIFHSLELEDYYRTDIHWRQDRLLDIADLLLNEMGAKGLAAGESYQEKSLYPFYGSYYGQAALKLEADTLVYLTNDILKEAVVYDHIDSNYSKVYMEEKFNSVDSYDFFLAGAKSIITITNPAPTTQRELIIFRDSFGSSIAPLLLQSYAKLTLIDLRYIGTDLLKDYMDFSKDADVLFLYNTLILNNSYMLK